MLEHLPTEQPNPASAGIDAKPTAEILRIINSEDRGVAAAVEAEIPRIAEAVDLVVDHIERGGRLFYIGAGTSGRLGVLDAAECPPTFQVSPDLIQGVIAGGEAALAQATEVTEDDPETGARDLRQRDFSALDVLLGIATSGRTPYVLGAVAEARRIGAATIGLSCNPDSELSRAVDVAITPLTGPEIIAGSTRLKAGTATKLILNMVSTAVMVRLGHVFGNLMVNVRPVNSKLEERARRIVATAGGVNFEDAARLLEEAGGEAKTAILMARFSATKEKAAGALADAGGRLSEAIQRWTDS